MGLTPLERYSYDLFTMIKGFRSPTGGQKAAKVVMFLLFRSMDVIVRIESQLGNEMSAGLKVTF